MAPGKGSIHSRNYTQEGVGIPCPLEGSREVLERPLGLSPFLRTGRRQRPRAKAHGSGRTRARTQPSLPQACWALHPPGECKTLSFCLAYPQSWMLRWGPLKNSSLPSEFSSPDEPELGVAARDSKGGDNLKNHLIKFVLCVRPHAEHCTSMAY